MNTEVNLFCISPNYSWEYKEREACSNFVIVIIWYALLCHYAIMPRVLHFSAFHYSQAIIIMMALFPTYILLIVGLPYNNIFNSYSLLKAHPLVARPDMISLLSVQLIHAFLLNSCSML